ncbi:HlyC/CorC family transporter [Ectothiorhodospiraceae bacterium BW-2]|nr:HlyC/CorC family transporter [Ectothiorhodospiraceae bacterium BW-2]
MVSAFFSGSETSIFSLNRYRLKHLRNKNHPGATRAYDLLQRPDRLIGIILLGNNFVNILASAIATIVAIRLLGESGVAVATLVLTVVILLFAEVAPKTVAALYPERFAFPASFLLKPLLKIFYPLVYVINAIANTMLKLAGLSVEHGQNQSLNTEELRTVVHEAGSSISGNHRRMLLNIFDLENVTVEDIMVPRNEIVGIDLESSLEEIHHLLINSQHTRLPVYRGDIDNMVGFIHLRKVLSLSKRQEISKEAVEQIVRPTYYIPESTPLSRQLLNFQREHHRIGLVVDEFGDIQGLATLDDILEEIVGEFTTDPSSNIREVHQQSDGTLLIDGTISIRELNRLLHWELNTSGPKTLNGKILEYMETIPEPGTSLLLDGYPIEIIQTSHNIVKTVRIDPGLARVVSPVTLGH